MGLQKTCTLFQQSFSSSPAARAAAAEAASTFDGVIINSCATSTQHMMKMHLMAPGSSYMAMRKVATVCQR